MAYKITPLTEHTGAEVTGIDLSKPSMPRQSCTHRAWATHHVLVVRDQKYEPGGSHPRRAGLWRVAAARQEDHHIPGFPRCIRHEPGISRHPADDPGETFHTRSLNHPAPPKATILYPVELPRSGGDTQYANMHLAYDELHRGDEEKD